MENKVIGFIGGGNMAYAIASGMVASGLVKPANIIASAKTDVKLNTAWKELGTRTTLVNKEVALTSDIIFLCVKPHILPGVLEHDLCGIDDLSKLYVSVAAGVTLEFMAEKLGVGKRIIRTMPNTPCLVRSGVVTFVCNESCSKEDSVLLKQLMDVTGFVAEVEEKQMDALSALAGCSPAWVYMMIEALSDGAVKNGVPRQLSYSLAAKAVEGAAKMVLMTGKHPGQLKDEVTSPNGSTICGVYELEQSGMRGIMMKAVDSATKRNQQLGKQ